MEQKKIQIKDLLKFTYNSIVNDIGLWLGLDLIAILIFVVGLAVGGILIAASIVALPFFFITNIILFSSTFLVFKIIVGTIPLGMTQISFDIHDHGSSSTSRLWSTNHLLGNYIIASMLYTLIFMAGFVLLIIPGIIFALQFSLYVAAMVDRNLGPIEALKASYRLTKGHIFQLFIIAIVLALLCAIPIIGFVFAMAMEHLFEVYVYRHLQHKN